MDYLAVGLVIKGNYTNSLPLFFEALQEAEKYGYADRMGSLLNNIGDTYAELGDYNRAIVYAKRNLILSQREHDLELEVLACLNLGEYFINLGQVDSALIYENKAYERNRVFKSSSMDQDILYNLGRIQAKFNNGDIALPYYRRSVLLLPQTSDLVYASKAMYGIGELFEEKAHVDSALYFYKHAYQMAQEGNYPSMMLNASKRIAGMYEANEKDSFLRYLKLSTVLRDSLLSAQKLREVQNLTYSEQQRQLELENMKEKEEEARNLNITYTFIGIGIILFITLFLLLSRSIIINEKWLSFLGVLGLLIVFEFINLLIHPTISRVTHESPLLMLLSMVAIASILIPLHHRLERWIKVRLVEKNRLARIRNAQKIIEEANRKDPEGDQKQTDPGMHELPGGSRGPFEP